jgi:ferredoxin/flavodoxin
MQIEKVYAVYFSGTGTTEKVVCAVAEELAAKLGTAWEAFDFTSPASRTQKKVFARGDLVVLGTPVYAGRVPNVLLPYLTGQLRGGDALAVPVVLFGNRNFDDALIELRNILEDDGFHTVAGAGFVGEHSFSRVLGAGRPDGRDMALTGQFAAGVAEKVAALETWPAPIAVRGEMPLRPYYTPRDRAGKSINILKVKPKTDEGKCTQCGLCAALCPMGSISKEDPAVVSGICIKCGACVKKCPNGAKYYDDAGYLYHQHELEEGYARRAEPEIFL